MLNINFVPDDYVRSNESRRTNVLYLVLFVIVMAGLGGSFMTIKMRQRALDVKDEEINRRLARAQEDISRFEELQAKRKAMMKTALTTAELLEPVPRSVLLASITNNLPAGTSLLRLKLTQKTAKNQPAQANPANTFNNAQSMTSAVVEARYSEKKLLETHIDIEGVAPSDLQVAAYIKKLSSSSLLDRVALVESKELKIDDTTFREFKLTAMLKKDIHLTQTDITKIRTKAENSTRIF